MRVLTAKPSGRLRLIRQCAIDRVTADAESGRDSARRFAASVHPLGQRSFSHQALEPSNMLPACSPRLPRSRPTLTTQFQFATIRPAAFERENATLKRLLADAELEKVRLKEIAKGHF